MELGRRCELKGMDGRRSTMDGVERRWKVEQMSGGGVS